MREKIVFADQLRGLAALSVMVVHYVVMFSALKGAYAGLSPLPFEPYPYLIPAIHFWLPVLDYGSLGVALFFLVSGFVIPFSLESLGTTTTGRFAFTVARLLRLWPTYIASIGVTFATLFFIAWYTDTPRSYQIWEIASQLSLFRDWLGSVEIGGVTWTLEIEVKFYLLAALFAPLLLYKPWVIIVGIDVLAAVGGAMGVKLPQTGFHASNFLFAPQFISFMLVGTAFHLHMKGRLSTIDVIAAAALALFLFWAFQYRIYFQNYTIAVAIFGACYWLRSHFREVKILKFFADISYPLYVMHASFGYMGLRLMMGAGIHPALSLILQMLASIGIAWIIHVLVEAPTRDFGRALSRAVARKPGTITT